MPFLEITNRSDLARELDTKEMNLTYLIYKVPEEDRYFSFEIPKRGGGMRTISAPNKMLKAIQRKIAHKLIEVYPGRTEVYGFAKGKNTYGGALAHLHKRWVVNLDLEDFFPSIHFGRVKGMFQAKPFCFNDTLARELANICCYKQRLPQGAPTSPAVSNFICWRLDNQLHLFAKKNRCTYTRYADDITFSTNLENLPEAIGIIDDNGKIQLSEELNGIIENNKFKINNDKVRYARRNSRQEVTGLIVNGKVPNVRRTYVRQIRAMLHACEKYGVESAATEHYNLYCPNKHPEEKSLAFMREIVGRAGYIRYVKRAIINGERIDSPVYKPIHRRIKNIFPDVRMAPIRYFIDESTMPVLLGEGKTDWKILMKALSVLQDQNEYKDIKIRFRQYDEAETMGYPQLFDICKYARNFGNQQTLLCLFDGDISQNFLDKLVLPGTNYKYWGGKVYSIVLPKPTTRENRQISIEQYFSDDEIKTPGKDGRRLFLSDEFNPETGELRINPSIKYKGSLKKFNRKYVFVIDDSVVDSEGHSLAMSKNDFAENVRLGNGAFDSFCYENFRLLFDVIREILNRDSKE